MNKDLKEIWREALAQIQLAISKTHFKAWFSQSYIENITEESVIIAVKNNIAKQYFQNEFHEIIENALTAILGKGMTITLTVQPKKETTETLPPLFTGETNLEQIGEDDIHKQYLQAIHILGISPKYIFENFIVGSSNRLAHAAAYAVAQNPGNAYNPLFIYGNVGLGKTHLIQAIANYLLLQDTQYKIVYSPSEVFLNEMVSAIRSGNAEHFRKKYREKDMLIIDDIQFIESKKGTQEEIFHTFNSMYQFNKQIVIASDRPPEEMPFLEARLRSRFEGGMVVDINEPEFETRLAILQQKREEKHLTIGDDILQFLAQRENVNVRELEGQLIKLGSLSIIGKEVVSVNDAIRVLGQKVVKRTLRIKPSDIITAVCNTYNISLKEIHSSTRTERIAFSRQVAMYLLRTELQLPLVEVAKCLHRKDHTTVIHAVEKIKTMKLTHEEIKIEIESIIKTLRE